MKKLTLNLVNISFIIYLYCWYNIWLGSQPGYSIFFELFNPFKLVLLGILFGIIFNTIMSIVARPSRHLKAYRAARKDFILFGFDKTIKFLEDIKVILQNNDKTGLKDQLGTFATLKYKPIYLDSFLRNLSNALLNDQDVNCFVEDVDFILNLIRTEHEKEIRWQRNEKVELTFEFKMISNYYSETSWYLINYELLNAKKAKSEANIEWKINSVLILKFWGIFGGMLLAVCTLMFAIFLNVPDLKLWLVGKYELIEGAEGFEIVEKSHFKYFFAIAFAISCVLSIALHVSQVCSIFKRENIHVGIGKLMFMWGSLIIIIGNICAFFLISSVKVYEPNASKNPNYAPPGMKESEFYKLVLDFIYCALSTALLMLIISETIDLLSSKNKKIGKVVISVIVPAIIYGLSAGLKIFDAVCSLNENPLDWTQNILNVNIIILAAFWIAICVLNFIRPSKNY